jgi:hypothetical protein
MVTFGLLTTLSRCEPERKCQNGDEISPHSRRVCRDSAGEPMGAENDWDAKALFKKISDQSMFL